MVDFDNPDYHYDKGEELYNTHMYQGALSEYVIAIGLHPYNPK